MLCTVCNGELIEEEGEEEMVHHCLVSVKEKDKTEPALPDNNPFSHIYYSCDNHTSYSPYPQPIHLMYHSLPAPNSKSTLLFPTLLSSIPLSPVLQYPTPPVSYLANTFVTISCITMSNTPVSYITNSCAAIIHTAISHAPTSHTFNSCITISHFAVFDIPVL